MQAHRHTDTWMYRHTDALGACRTQSAHRSMCFFPFRALHLHVLQVQTEKDIKDDQPDILELFLPWTPTAGT